MPPFPADLARLLDGCEILPVEAGEAGATVLRLVRPDGVRYLKVGEGRIADDVADEFARLRWLDGRFPCPAVRHFSHADGRAWLLTDALDGRTGDEWLDEDPAHLPTVVAAARDLLRRLHALPVADCPFEAGAALRLAAARRNVADGLVDTDDFAAEHRGWSAARMLAKVERLSDAMPPGERVVTHGDFSLGNILLDAEGRATGLIDVGRLGVADPYQDIAILWENLREFDARAAEEFAAAMARGPVSAERLAFHRVLDELF